MSVPTDESYIVKQRDLAEIIRLQDAGALEEFLEQPLTAIAEATTAILPRYFAPVGRIVQGALKGKMFEQVQREVRQLREKGRIPADFAAKKYGFKSWVELLTTIDEDTPDEDRLGALKAMFYSVNKINSTDDLQRLDYLPAFKYVGRSNDDNLRVRHRLSGFRFFGCRAGCR
jgi:hypothetical protein